MACELDQGLALLHKASGTFYVLGELESFIWEMLSSPATSREVAAAVSDAYDAPYDQVERDVRNFLQSMIDADLLELDAAACS
jgi:hypothetical protein